MTSNPMKIKLKVSISWWFIYLYVPMLRTMCDITAMRPDEDKLNKVIRLAVRVERVQCDLSLCYYSQW